jgi:hypothetical protein
LRKAPPLNRIESKIVMRELYEKVFQIYDHDSIQSQKEPLALVGMRWQESILDGSRQDELMQQFVDVNIHKHTGMSWVEFLECTRDEINQWLLVCERKSLKDAKDGLDALNALGMKDK